MRLLTALLILLASGATAQPADLIITNARVWTADDEQPWAAAVAIRGEYLTAVGSGEDVGRQRGPDTRVLDAEGRLVVPGFIDNHTHFNQAGALLLGVNLLDVADEQRLAQRVAEARDRLPAGAWITGGSWGAYEAWGMGTAGADDGPAAGHPALLARWDRSEHLANRLALERAGLDCRQPVDGLECVNGEATGHVAGEALQRVRAAVDEPTREQRLLEAERALEQLRRYGVTGIHDITPAGQMRVFQDLRQQGRLTTRVYARPTLDRWEELAALGIEHGFGDDYLRIGGLKGFVDGIMGASTAMFYEPFDHTGGYGIWRDMMDHPDGMQGLIDGSLRAGLWPQIHAIGDRAIDTLLTMYETATAGMDAPAGARLRVIHAQHLRGPEVARRMAAAGVIAEVQPYHAIDDMRWMEERIGPERIRWTYAFRTLHDAGVRLSFGSDWPGTQASWYPANPLLGIYAAVTRQTLDGQPAAGWIPEERVRVETALRAYTINNAYAEGTEDRKGSITEGKLADLVMIDRDLFTIDPAEIKDAQVVLSVLGGRVIFER